MGTKGIAIFNIFKISIQWGDNIRDWDLSSYKRVGPRVFIFAIRYCTTINFWQMLFQSWFILSFRAKSRSWRPAFTYRKRITFLILNSQFFGWTLRWFSWSGLYFGLFLFIRDKRLGCFWKHKTCFKLCAISCTWKILFHLKLQSL